MPFYRRQSHFLGFTLFCSLLISHTALYAAGFYLQELGTPSSIGTAGTARTINNYGPESAFGNPAGMTGLKEDAILIGSQVLVPKIKFDSDIATAGGSDGGNAGNTALIPSFFAVKSISENARAGFSVVAPLGGGYDYGSNFVGRYSAQEVELSGVAISPSFGYKVNDKLSIGGGISFLYTLFEMDIALNRGEDPDGQARIEDAEDWGQQFFVGIQYQLNEKTLLGILYRSEADIDLDGDFTIRGLPTPVSGSASAGWDNPQLIEIGLSYQVNEKLIIFTQANWEDWSAFSENTFQISGSGVGTTVTDLDRDFRDTYRFGVGMSYRTGKDMYLFGTSYDSSPVSNSNRTFDLPVDEQFRIATAFIHAPEEAFSYGISLSWVYFGEGKVDQTSQGVRAKGEFEENWGLFIGGNVTYRF